MHLHPGQWKAWQSDRRIIVVLAGYQSGKTAMGPLWLHREMARRGPGDYLAAGPTSPLFDKKALPELRLLFEQTLRIGTWRPSSPRRLEITAPERVWAADDVKQMRLPANVFIGSAVRPESLESMTVKAAWLDEAGQNAFSLDAWRAVDRRTAIHQGRILITSTPYNLGWLKTELYDRWKDGDPDVEVVNFESTMNPAFPKEEAERAERVLPTWYFNMMYRGQFERPAGMIYDCFVDEYKGEKGGHKVRPFEIPAHWPRAVGLDFGGVNTAKLFLAQDPDTGYWYVYAEDLSGGKTSSDHALEVKAELLGYPLDEAKEYESEIAERWTGGNLLACYGGAKSEGQWRSEWSAAEIYVQEPEVADVEVGIQRVYGLLKGFRLFVFDTCKGTLDELVRYARELDSNQQPTEKIADKESFHRMDALRYISQALQAIEPVFGEVRPEVTVYHATPGGLFGRHEPRRVFEQGQAGARPGSYVDSQVSPVGVSGGGSGVRYRHVACGYETSSSPALRERVRSENPPATLFCAGCQAPFVVAEFTWAEG